MSAIRVITGSRDLPIQGWGLSTLHNDLVMSNGDDHIVFRDPYTFAETRRITVHQGTTNIRNINELEVIDGKICKRGGSEKERGGGGGRRERRRRRKKRSKRARAREREREEEEEEEEQESESANAKRLARVRALLSISNGAYVVRGNIYIFTM